MNLVNPYIYTQLIAEVFDSVSSYALRSIDSFSGAVVRVRRSSDSTEQDFTATEITDGTLTTFTGANDGFVVTWYDQKGSNNATNPTASEQPRIVNSGALETENGLPVIRFLSTNLITIGGTIADFINGTDLPNSIISIAGTDDLVTQQIIYALNDSGSLDTFQERYDPANTRFKTWKRANFHDSRLIETNYNFTNNGLILLERFDSGTVLNLFANNTQLETNTSFNITGAIAFSTMDIGGNGNGTGSFTGYYNELHIFDSNKLSNRTAYLNNIKNHYIKPNFAFGLQNILSYSGNVVRARDNGVGEADYTASGYTSISTANDVLAVTLYNQGSDSITNQLTNGTAAEQPKGYISGTIETDSNGNPVAVFDGSNDYLESTDSNLLGVFSGLNPSYSYIMVLEPTTSGTGENLLDIRDSVNTSNWQLFRWNGTEFRFLGRNSAGSFMYDETVTGKSLNNQYIVEFYSTGSNFTVYINNVLELNNVAQSSATYTPDTFGFGANATTGGANFQGFIKEFQIFNSDVSSQREIIYNDISTRWS